MSLFQFLTEYYPIVFVWISGITIVIMYRNSWPLSFRILAFFILLYVVSDTTGSIMGVVYKMRNHFVYNFLYTIQFIVISIFFYYQANSSLIRKVILYFLFIFPLFVFVNAIWFQNFFTLQTFSYVFGGSFVILLSVSYLWQLYVSEETHSIFRDPVFWFSLAWLLNFAVTVPFFGMLNYLNSNFPDLALNYYLLVIDISDCLRSILLTIGFLCIRVMKK